MRATLKLLQHSARVTLFTRANCSLCDTAKHTLANVTKNKIVDYSEIDVMAQGQEKWKDAYEFDTPVVCPSLITMRVRGLHFLATCSKSAAHILETGHRDRGI